MTDKDKTPKPSWGGCVVFGIANIIFVFLCTKFDTILLSTSLLLLIVVGTVLSAACIRDDWKAGFKKSALGCIAGLLLNLTAAVLYVFNVLSSLIGLLGFFTGQ